MLESTPFSEKLQGAKWQPIYDNMVKIVPYGACPTVQKLGKSPTLHDIFEHDDISGTLWRVREESQTLKAHFPEQGDTAACGIVPLTSMVTLLAIKNNKTSFRCTIAEPLLAGDVIRVAPGGIQLINKNGSEGTMIVHSHSIEKEHTELGKNIHIPSHILLSKQYPLNLPQGKSFQFVTAAQSSEGHTFFRGTYRTPSGLERGHPHRIPEFDTGVLLEIVAQTGAAVGSNLLREGEIFVYEGGVFNFDTNIELMEAESLITTAQLTKNEGGKISYLYCLRRSRDEKPVLWGQVDAVTIEYTRMVRLTEMLKQKRAKVKKVEN